MDRILDEIEVRIIGSLIEKQVTTPDYYPLTLNALMHACNQLSNRDPVVSYDERTVAQAIESLRGKNMTYVFYGSDSRVPKYKQMMTELFHLSPQETAVMCVLMLRGPQTIGELRGRTSRLFEFADLAEVEATLEGLIARDDPALVIKLPRQIGRKESRYAHALTGEVPMVEQVSPGREPTTLKVKAEDEKLSRLETEVEALRQEVGHLKQQFEDFKRQFE